MNATRLVSGISLFLTLMLPVQGHASDARANIRRNPTPRRLAAAPTNSFDGFIRYPAEVRTFVPMENSTAYFRDVFTGGSTSHGGASDGDSVHAQIFGPSGTLLATWPKFVFHSDYQGQHDCWVSGLGGGLCDAPDIFIDWFLQTQCAQDGVYTMKFFRNDVEFASGTFTMLPQVPPNTVALYNQLQYPTTDYDKLCYYVGASGTRIPKSNHTCKNPREANERQYSVKAKGCYMSDVAAIMTYFGQSTDPVQLNSILNSFSDGFQGGNVNQIRASMYTTQQGTKMKPIGKVADIGKAICSYGPQMLGVKCYRDDNDGKIKAGHWVTVTGLSKDHSTWQIMDPAGGINTTLAKYGNTACDNRVFQGPEYDFTTDNHVRIVFHSPVTLLLTDPQGRRLGDDPATGQSFEEIPGAYYESGGIEDQETGEPDDDPTKVLYVPDPVSGDYALQVTGTDNGTYSSEFLFYDNAGALNESDLQDVPIGLGSVQQLFFTYNSASGSTTHLQGGFNGGGQRPRDVNKFLTYGNPSDSPVSVPAGSTSFPLLIFYSGESIPATFSASLNGADVHALFHPTAGASELLVLPLQSGRNVLQLSIQGNLPSRVATDTDRIVFSVP